MEKTIYAFILLITLSLNLKAQSPIWQGFIDSVVTLSSPRSCDLNNDGIKDIVVGGGKDGFFVTNGIMALNGIDGDLLWKHNARDEVFGSAIFQDINNDGVKDVFIVGRKAQLVCLDGTDGNLIWDFFPHGTNPVDSGWYNFYNPQFIHDVDNDGKPDILVSNGGDHAAPAWDPNRPTGKLMVISSVNGSILAQAEVLDGAETYCSPIVADIQNNGIKWILYGTGGEHFGGSFWACPLNDLINNQSLASSIQLLTDPVKGYVAPPSIHKNITGQYDILVQGFGGKISKIKGASFSLAWEYYHPNTQSSAALVIGNFTGTITPDVFAVLSKGQVPSYTDYYQLMLDGDNGQPIFLDSIGAIHYASANAVDFNNDGRDEALISVTHFENGHFKHKIHSIDFTTQTVSQIGATKTGVNIASTPLIDDLDNNNLLDLIYITKLDSINPMGFKGFYVDRLELTSIKPNVGIAWGSYMGTFADGIYNFPLPNCGTGSVVSSISQTNPLCNGQANGSISVNLVNPGLTHTFLWSNNELTQNISGLTAGTYTLMATNDAGCYEYRQITLNDPHVISYGGIVSPTCPNGTNGNVISSSTGCPCMFNMCQFMWDNGVAVATNNMAHEGYNVLTILHTDGCLVTDSVFVPYAPQVLTTNAIEPIVCEGGHNGSISISDNGPYPITYFNWSTGESTSSINNLEEGIYSVQIKDSRGCVDSLFFEIETLVSDSVHFDATVLNVSCFGDSDGSITLLETGLYPFTSVLWNTQSTNNPITGLTPNTYSVVIYDSRGCSDSAIYTITQPSALEIDLVSTIASGAQSLDGTAQATISGGTPPYQIEWNDPNNQNNALAVYLNPGWYTINVTDANGCEHSENIFVGMVGITELSSFGYSIYPNPTNGIINFSTELIGYEFKITDINGRLITSGMLNQSTIDISQLSNGFYQLEFTIENQRFVTKIVKH